MKKAVTLIIPDMHIPFHHPDALRFLRELKAEFKPTMVLQSGDLVDQHALGRWVPEADALGNNSELQESRAIVGQLGKLFPNLHWVLGNHDIRVAKRAKEMKIPSAFMRNLRDVYGCPSTWHVADHYVVDGVRFFHGDGFTGKMAAITAAERLRQSVVIGHVHAYPGVIWSVGAKDTIFGLNCGCLIDPAEYAFNYAKDTPSKPGLGVGLIEAGVPRWLPMN